MTAAIKFLVNKKYTFEASHKLPNYDGACANLHGHSYKLFIEITTEHPHEKLNNKGMVLDFNDLDDLVEPLVEMLDHSFLNDHFDNPTAELMAEWFFKKLETKLQGRFQKVHRVRLYETEKCFAEVVEIEGETE